MESAESRTAIVIVDHGSRRRESHEMLLQVVAQYAANAPFSIVEPAHMELAEPSIATAFARCVEQGAEMIVVYPYFLLPGQHWDRDIPQLSAAAAKNHPGLRYLVTAPQGLHPLVIRIMQDRIEQCLAHAVSGGAACDLCAGTEKCRVSGEPL